MSRRIRVALLLNLIGWGAAAVCLLHTTAITMTLFFFLGIPAFGLALLLYLLEVLRDLRRHRVI